MGELGQSLQRQQRHSGISTSHPKGNRGKSIHATPPLLPLDDLPLRNTQSGDYDAFLNSGLMIEERFQKPSLGCGEQ